MCIRDRHYSDHWIRPEWNSSGAQHIHSAKTKRHQRNAACLRKMCLIDHIQKGGSHHKNTNQALPHIHHPIVNIRQQNRRSPARSKQNACSEQMFTTSLYHRFWKMQEVCRKNVRYFLSPSVLQANRRALCQDIFSCSRNLSEIMAINSEFVGLPRPLWMV